MVFLAFFIYRIRFRSDSSWLLTLTLGGLPALVIVTASLLLPVENREAQPPTVGDGRPTFWKRAVVRAAAVVLFVELSALLWPGVVPAWATTILVIVLSLWMAFRLMDGPPTKISAEERHPGSGASDQEAIAVEPHDIEEGPETDRGRVR